MSQFKINSITDKSGTSGPVIAGVSTNNSTGCMIIPVGPTEHRGGRGRGVFGGGSPSYVNTMNFITISTAGNAEDFGDMTTGHQSRASFASATRGLFSGGYVPSGTSTAIDYVIISSKGGANDFGDHHRGVTNGNGQCANGTRGLLAGGYLAPTPFNTIDFITIATTGSTSDYGEIDDGSTGGYSPMASPTRAVFARAGQNLNFINFTSGGKTQIFGDMRGDSRVSHIASCSSSTRGIMAGGEAPSRVNTITYITINTLGNGIDFGDLMAVRNDQDAVASQTRGFVVAGSTGSTTNLIDFVTISTTGNSSDFGDLTQARTQPLAFSDVHGGLG